MKQHWAPCAATSDLSPKAFTPVMSPPLWEDTVSQIQCSCCRRNPAVPWCFFPPYLLETIALLVGNGEPHSCQHGKHGMGGKIHNTCLQGYRTHPWSSLRCQGRKCPSTGCKAHCKNTIILSSGYFISVVKEIVAI